MSDQDPNVLHFHAEWNAVSFPASHSYIGKIVLHTVRSVISSTERDVFRHLVDRNAQGRWAYIDDKASAEEIAGFEIPGQTALDVSLEPNAGTKQSQKIRYLLQEIWCELNDQQPSKLNKAAIKAHYDERTQEIVRSLSKELEAIRQAKHYEAKGY